MTVATLHASCVAFADAGILITGEPGAGKSTLAFRLIAFGARLVADDRVELSRCEGALQAAAPEAIRGRIEARGVGILELPFRESAVLRLVADLDRVEALRLPPAREAEWLGVRVPLLHARSLPDAAAVIAAWAGGGGRREPA